MIKVGISRLAADFRWTTELSLSLSSRELPLEVRCVRDRFNAITRFSSRENMSRKYVPKEKRMLQQDHFPLEGATSVSNQRSFVGKMTSIRQKLAMLMTSSNLSSTFVIKDT
jgi:hypothetical protein